MNTINTALSPNFTSRYKLDANQEMPSQDACLTRDAFIGAWGAQAKNSKSVLQKLNAFYSQHGAYEQDKNTPCEITLNLKDTDDNNFEYCMEQIGQKFSKLA
jgi:hypothetical protein